MPDTGSACQLFGYRMLCSSKLNIYFTRLFQLYFKQEDADNGITLLATLHAECQSDTIRQNWVLKGLFLAWKLHKFPGLKCLDAAFVYFPQRYDCYVSASRSLHYPGLDLYRLRHHINGSGILVFGCRLTTVYWGAYKG